VRCSGREPVVSKDKKIISRYNRFSPRAAQRVANVFLPCDGRETLWLSAWKKSASESIDFRKIETIDQIVTLFVFVKFRSIGEFCVRETNDGILNVF